MWTSLVAEWVRICLPMQGPWFNPWSGMSPHALELLSPHTRAEELHLLSLYAAATETHGPGAYAWQQEKPPHHSEKPVHPNEE